MAVGEAPHPDLAEDRDEGALVVGLGVAAGDPVVAGHLLQALLELGPQVQVVLVELAQQFEAVGSQALFELGVGEVGRPSVAEEVDELPVAAFGGGKGLAQALPPSWATSASSPALPSASSLWRALR